MAPRNYGAERKSMRMKEAHPPKQTNVSKPKKQFSTTHMFKSRSTRAQKTSLEKPEVFAAEARFQKSAKPGRKSHGMSHAAKRPPSPSPPPRKSKKQKHPLAIELKDSITTYRDAVTENAQVLIDEKHNSLLSRLENGPQDSSADDDRLAKAEALITRVNLPLSETEVKVQYKNPPRIERIPIGVTLSAFQKVMDDKKMKLGALYVQLEDVRRDIALLGAELLGDASYPARYGYEVDDPDDEKYTMGGMAGAEAAAAAMVRRAGAKLVEVAEESYNELAKSEREIADREKEMNKRKKALMAYIQGG